MHMIILRIILGGLGGLWGGRGVAHTYTKKSENYRRMDPKCLDRHTAPATWRNRNSGPK